MRERLDTKREFTFVKRAKSFVSAGRGVWVLIRTTPNMWVHLAALALVIAFGINLSISPPEWMFLVLAAGFVLAAEAFNTAIEIDMDLTSPDFHPYAKDTKDLAAGAVLISAITAAIIGALVFGPYIL